MGYYPTTVSKGVGFERVKRFLSKEEIKDLEPLVEKGKLRFWGCRGKGRFLWASMKVNDLILFVPGGIGVYTDFGRMAYKSQNIELAKAMSKFGLWPESE